MKHPNQFKIHNITTKTKDARSDQIGFIFVSIVWSVDESDFDMFKRCTEEYERVLVVSNIDEDKKYRSGLEISYGEPRSNHSIPIYIHNPNMEDPKVWAWRYRDAEFEYLEKFNVFRYAQYVDNSPATQGIITALKNLKDGCLKTRTTDAYNLLGLIRALDALWD